MSTKSQKYTSSQMLLYPLKFDPIYQYRLWGGRHLADLLTAPLPGDGPIGEAWILSDREDHQSLVANGPLKGHTINQLMENEQEQLLGKLAGQFKRFPLLLKFLDVHEMLSVQVHPSDLKKDYLPVGEYGKTEAWVVLEAAPDSRIYAGLKPGTTDGDGQIEYDGTIYIIGKGDVFLLPAVAGVCTFKPRKAVILLEIALPE